ncbi:hypothetical protein JTE90_019513 [Oedothorax gibbosus]|uniref:Uncharacterized protein n=1 Tax=Oedothorax gibbosus TaxID=931172 RepID=A0AAV6VFX8_9ARAC|nr:hypothetical protein JTE90_019513 [Oedothorax gibbosus]
MIPPSAILTSTSISRTSQLPLPIVIQEAATMSRAFLALASCLVLAHAAAGQHSGSSQSGSSHSQQQQHHSPAYLMPSPVTRQSGLGGALSGLGGLGGFGGGLGGGGGLSSILSSLGGIGGGNMLSTALPLLMVVGLGAMLMPLLGGVFFRESQKRGLPSVSPAFLEGVTDILDKFIKALDAVEKKYP